MKITVHYSTKTGTIKQAFSKIFPYLKIEFVKNETNLNSETKFNNTILHNRFLGEINENLRQGIIQIKSDDKPASLEQSFRQQFGLPIQVYRKQKKQWILAVSPGDLTLYQQNEIAKSTCALSMENNLTHDAEA